MLVSLSSCPKTFLNAGQHKAFIYCNVIALMIAYNTAPAMNIGTGYVKTLCALMHLNGQIKTLYFAFLVQSIFIPLFQINRCCKILNMLSTKFSFQLTTGRQK
jgi:hypothetical protein